MEPTANKPQDIVDTTDSLEAVGACRSMKNLLFWVIFIGLLLPQMIFWLDRLDIVDKSACASCKAKAACVKCAGCSKKPCQKAPAKEQAETPASVSISAPVSLSAVVDRPTETVAGEIDKEIMLEDPADDIPADLPMETEPEAPAPAEPKEPFKIPCRLLSILVVVCNFLVLMAAMMYCLSLLMCLKISLTGRLGGINHVTRAFFVSLVLVMVLIPWQKLLPGVLLGVVWTPGELLCGRWAKADASTFWKVLFYVRFAGLWVVAMWLLFWAQIRSAKWAQATLRRLGIVR